VAVAEIKGKLNMSKKWKVLFLCTGNSCRSQMAEGWARHLKSDVIEPYSAGIETHGLNLNAVKVMAEAGVDISGHHSKHLDELKDIDFDYVITVCDNAHESCPVFHGKTKVVYVGFDDPPRLAREVKTQEEALDIYRRVRDEIRAFVEKCPTSFTERIIMGKETEPAKVCGPGCDCGKSSGNTRAKVIACVVVLLAVCGILVYKAMGAKQDAPAETGTTFTVPTANQVNGQEAATPSIDIKTPVVKSAQEKIRVGPSLASPSFLNKVAIDQDAVFVFVPAQGDETVSKATMDAIASAQHKLKSSNIRIGLYTLLPIAPEYGSITSQITLPWILVISKGRGMGAVSGEITETKLLQAYVASSSAGGCCPSGGGSAGCSPSGQVPGSK
jgi:arsenate reductase